jgi:hypothetical protein
MKSRLPMNSGRESIETESRYICVYNDIQGFQAFLSNSHKGRTISLNLNLNLLSSQVSQLAQYKRTTTGFTRIGKSIVQNN